MLWTVANPGTAYLGNMCCASIFLSPVLGLVEGWLIARFLRVPAKPIVHRMILANYFSGFFGFWVLIAFGKLWFASIPLEQVLPMLRLYMLLTWALAFVFAVVLEVPFAIWGIRKQRAPLGLGLASFVGSQLVTVGLMGVVIWFVGTLHAARDMHWVQAPDFLPKGMSGAVYIAGVKGDSLVRVPLEGGDAEPILEQVLDLGDTQSYWTVIRFVDDGTGRVVLSVHRRGDGDDPEWEPVAQLVGGEAVPSEELEHIGIAQDFRNEGATPSAEELKQATADLITWNFGNEYFAPLPTLCVLSDRIVLFPVMLSSTEANALVVVDTEGRQGCVLYASSEWTALDGFVVVLGEHELIPLNPDSP